MPSEPRKHDLGKEKGVRDEEEKRIRSDKGRKPIQEKCKAALKSPVTWVSIAAVSEGKRKDERGGS